MQYEVQLNNFQGPLDLLLFFIRRDEIDIMDIPIASITQEYLEYMEALQTLNVAIAGEFIVMAATLMRIKAKMLLPKIHGEEGEDFEDPRTELMHRLLEYQRFKVASGNLGLMLETHSNQFPRSVSLNYDNSEGDANYYLEEVSLFNLVQLFKNLIENLPPVIELITAREEIHVREQIAFILSKFVEKNRYLFSELFPFFKTKQEIITAFLAILEMIKSKQIQVLQKGVFGEIVLERSEA